MAGEQTKERIFVGAVQLFSEQGYAETTIRQMARAVHVNEATIYIYFSSKAEILGEILKVFEERLDRIFFSGIIVNDDSTIGDPREFLHRFLWNVLIEKDSFMKQTFRIVCIEEFSNPKAGALVTERLSREVAEKTCHALDKLAQAGKIPEYDRGTFSVLWAQAIFSSAVMASHRDNRREAKKNLLRINESLLDMAMAGHIPMENRMLVK